MKLHHLPLPGLTPYAHAANLQASLVSRFLAHKANPESVSAPPPTLITAQFNPVYTCGRREIGTITKEQQDFLTKAGPHGKAEFHEALRGGQTTFHGPRQLVAYSILDLRSHGLTARNYVCLLEGTVIATLKRYGVEGIRTENTGVWVTPDTKIASIGVHLRRNVSSHGVGLNVGLERWWWERIVACGLPEKRPTSIREEGAADVGVEDVGIAFAEELAKGLKNIDGVERMNEETLG
ncbi:octanoyltransferase [Aulographum hederae CBS 113979]|uniref:Octanoyltransferase n=1 Tax=Aulographum hederae CBS 113979 TaxID=1176131 RepID=A0A6G1GSC1_9PEZI|nr:octanoyltransferase [Aulographum hederae CBS 113979]